VLVYFGSLSRIWDELVTYAKKPSCKCAGCTCDIDKQVTDLREDKMVYWIYYGLEITNIYTYNSNKHFI